MNHVAGPGGTLLPERYMATSALDDARAFLVHAGSGAHDTGRLTARLTRWWAHVSQTCGPASPLRAIFDLVAMPWLGMFGFRCHDAIFEGHVCRARLTAGTNTPVALVVTCWASHRPTRWVDLARQASEIGARWGILIAPPFISIVAARGFAVRRSIDLRLPDALAPEWLLLTTTVAHAAAFGDSHPCLLDHLVDRAGEFQDGVRSDLQRGVETALAALRPVVGALAHPKQKIGSHRHLPVGGPAAFDEALTLVYRILFLLFAESRGLTPVDAPIYQGAYAVTRFCRDAVRGRSTGLWTSVAAASRLARIGCRAPELRVAAFNGALFARESAPRLEAAVPRSTRPIAARCDAAMQAVLTALGTRTTRRGPESIAYRDLGVEQLGAVYERVLDLPRDTVRDPVAVPERNRGRRRSPRHSTTRRRSGTFYTPQPLADHLVRKVLTPLVRDRAADEILDLRVVDPAMGSGAFLVAACRFLAGAYEEALITEGRLSTEDVDGHVRAHIRRLIAERCLAGVDSNPMAVQLARLSLWLATLARDKPLSFLDHRLRVGDSLVGGWPGDLWRLGGSRTRRQTPLLDDEVFDEAMRRATKPLRYIVEGPSDTVGHIHAKAAAWCQLTSRRSPLRRWRLALHLWCARWFTPKPPDPREARALVDALLRGDRTFDPAHVEARLTSIAELADERRFFHWPIEFPDVFSKAIPGFDAVIGNPPWEMVRRDDGEGGEVKPLVTFVRESGLYPSCTHGHLNLYQAFVDRALSLARPGGRLGLVLPWSIAVDEGAAPIRDRLWREAQVETITGIDNARGLFPIHRGVRIVCFSATRRSATHTTRAVFGISTGEELDALPAHPDRIHYPVAFTRAELSRLTGTALRIPDLRHRLDVRLLTDLRDRFAPLGSTGGWNVSFGRELNATGIRPHLQPSGVPVVEGKHLAPFRVEGQPANFLAPSLARRLLASDRWMRPRLGYRDVSAVGNRFTLIATVIPAGAVTTHTVFCARQLPADVRQHFLCALLNSFVINHVVRLLMGSHVTTALAESLPVPAWQGDALDCRIADLARGLATHLQPQAVRRRVDVGVDQYPRRHTELQALLAHRFGIDEPMLVHLLEATPGLPTVDRAKVLHTFEETAVCLADNQR